MGISVRENGIDNMVTNINKLNPDIVFFCGDLVDESTPTKLKVYAGPDHPHAAQNPTPYVFTQVSQIMKK